MAVSGGDIGADHGLLVRTAGQAGNEFITADTAKQWVVAPFIADATDLPALLVVAGIEQGFVAETEQLASNAVVEAAGIGIRGAKVATVADKQAVTGKQAAIAVKTKAMWRVARRGNDTECQAAANDALAISDLEVSIGYLRVADQNFCTRRLTQGCCGCRMLKVQMGFENAVQLPMHFIQYAEVERQVIQHRVDHQCLPAIRAGQQVGQ